MKYNEELGIIDVVLRRIVDGRKYVRLWCGEHRDLFAYHLRSLDLRETELLREQAKGVYVI